MTLPKEMLDWPWERFKAAADAMEEVQAAMDMALGLSDRMGHVWHEYPSAATVEELFAAAASNPELTADLAAVEAAWRRVAVAQGSAIAVGIMSEQERSVVITDDGGFAFLDGEAPDQ